MKKFFIVLISCMVLAVVPATSYAKKKIYVGSPTSSYPSGPRRGSGSDILTLDIDEDSCALYITFTENVPDLTLSITSNGITYEEDTVNAVNGQTLTYYLDSYDEGDYELTVEVENTVVSIYTVTITDE